MKTCCVTGHRPQGFPFDHENENAHAHIIYTHILYKRAEALIRGGYTEFITGMAKGADLDFACAVIYHKTKTFRDILDISLEAAIPYPNQTRGWSDYYWNQYDYVLSQCDKKTTVSMSYFPGCEQRRNQYMVDKSDLVFAVWNGSNKGGTWNTIRYAGQKRVPVEFLMLNDAMREFQV